MVYKFLDIIINLCLKWQHKLRERSLPNECREDWIKGYSKFKKKYKYYSE